MGGIFFKGSDHEDVKCCRPPSLGLSFSPLPPGRTKAASGHSYSKSVAVPQQGCEDRMAGWVWLTAQSVSSTGLEGEVDKREET